ncbi:hypothetical protein AVEN_159260-1 [Araneus ventricosus]|uniref:Uncharacterized protein n=1 Tax=Araneus ventricosus TaxID=182803 RepID=A0A4Y2A077_ARAVE|nr:hypothetical protein AVEN_159260-1 [Araneus ventricosus]
MLSLLDGIRGTKPSSSQLPSAGGFNRNAWRHQQALQQQGSRTLAFDTLKPGKDSCPDNFPLGTGRATHDRSHR